RPHTRPHRNHHNSYHHTPASRLSFFNTPATTEIYTLSLHDALPICGPGIPGRDPVLHVSPRVRAALSHRLRDALPDNPGDALPRSEEHTSELQSRFDLVCRLLLEKKKIYI